MRKILILASVFAAACSTAPAQPPVHGVTPGRKCETAGTDQFIGKPGDSETGAAILRASNAAVLRWAPVGYMLTMDYREDRVTVRLDADRNVTQITCG